MPHSYELSHELSMDNPRAYNTTLFRSLGKHSHYGALAAARNGVTESNIHDRVALDPTDFHSESLGGGVFIVGTRPMDATTKGRLLYHDERFGYPQEATYRLLTN